MYCRRHSGIKKDEIVADYYDWYNALGNRLTI
jgi:hypothetical protein